MAAPLAASELLRHTPSNFGTTQLHRGRQQCRHRRAAAVPQAALQTLSRPNFDVAQLPFVSARPELASTVPATRDEAAVLLERLQLEAAASGTQGGVNVVAFTGDVRSALTTYLVSSVFDENTIGCIGITKGLTQEELQQAHFVADIMGIELVEADLQSPRQPSQAALQGIADAVHAAVPHGDLVVFSGASWDSPHATSAADSGLVLPLAGLTDSAVYAVAKMLGVPILPRCRMQHTEQAADQRQQQRRSKLPAMQTVYAKQLSLVGS